MIEFKGELSENCKKFIINNEAKLSRLSASIVSIPFAIAAVWISVAIDLFYLIIIPGLLFIILVAGVKPKENIYGLIMTKRVAVIENSIECEGEEFYVSRAVDQVKQVVDYGEWYKIDFYFPYKCQRFICQKDLIAQGTIEEFERIFFEKIIRHRSYNNEI